MTHDVLFTVPRHERRRLLGEEARRRTSGNWGPWERVELQPGAVARGGWTEQVSVAHRNRVFCVLERLVYPGVTHLAVTSLSAVRPTWHEMQRIKDEIAGPDRFGVEVYPPRDEIVDGADMFHLWVWPEGKTLPFGLHL